MSRHTGVLEWVAATTRTTPNPNKAATEETNHGSGAALSLLMKMKKGTKRKGYLDLRFMSLITFLAISA
jgi:hypothetical protein